MAREHEDRLRSGIGMTSQRTRERLIQRLYEEGVSNAKVLEVIGAHRVICSSTRRWHTALTKTRRCRSATTRPFPSLIWWRA